nr:MMPL family transporter [Thermoanaerobaculia bacterium]
RSRRVIVHLAAVLAVATAHAQSPVPVTRELAAVPHVGAVESVFGDVVRVEAALRGTSYRELAPEVQSGRARLSRTAVEQALLLLGSLRNSPLEERIEGTYHRTRITTLINSASYSRIDHLLAVARNAAGGFAIKPFGDGWVSYVAVRLLVVGQMQSVGFALLANALLLFLLFRSPGPTLVALAPITLCVVAVFAVLATTGTPLGIANSMFAAIALGIGVDYSIHLVSQQRRNAARGLPRDEAFRQAFEATAPAIVKSATAISCGLAVLLLSEVLPNLQLGLLVCLSLTICAVATLLLVPALILSSKRSLPAANEPSRALSNSLRSRV